MPLDYRSSLDDSQFQRALDRMDKETHSVSSSIGRHFGIAGAGVAGVAGALALAVKESVNFASAIVDSAEAINLGTEAFQGYIGVLETGGVTQERFEKQFGKMVQAIDDAREGNEKIRQSFDDLKVTWETLSAGTPEDVFRAIAVGLHDAEDATIAYGAASDIFGKGSGRMIAQLREMGAGLGEHAEQVNKLGEEQTKTLDAWGDAWASWGRRAKVWIADVVATAAKGVQMFAEDATFLATGTNRGDVESGLAGALAPAAPKAAAPGPDPRLVKREEENRKLLKESQREYDKMAAEAAETAEKAAQKTEEECEAIERKIRLKEQELEVERKLLEKQTEAQRRMDEAIAGVDRLEQQNRDIRGSALAFGMLSPDERRDQVRNERDVKNEQKRQDRLIQNGQRDARFGARGEGRDIADIGLNQPTIDALKRAFFEANAQLVAG